MTMPSERTRSIIQTREFLVDLSRDKTLPEALRTEARRLLRHYPTADEVLLAGKVEEQREDGRIADLACGVGALDQEDDGKRHREERCGHEADDVEAHVRPARWHEVPNGVDHQPEECGQEHGACYAEQLAAGRKWDEIK